jgi:hypothetical protein
MDGLSDEAAGPRWRTRVDPFQEHWDEIVELLSVAPELEAVTVFDYLRGKHPGRYEDGQLRTLQRRLRRWRAQHGAAQELFFDQVHKPGATAQLDWMDGNGLGVIIGGAPFAHKLCHCAAVYSKWEWAKTCFSEDFLSLRLTLEEAFTRLGGVTRELAVDNGSAATRCLAQGSGKRDFNAAFEHLLKHFGIAGRRINIGQAHENGTVEVLHHHFRRRLDQALMLRGCRTFDSRDAYERFVIQQLEAGNANRERKVAEERAHLLPLPPTRYPDFEEERAQVGAGGTMRLKKKTYSVPSRLKGYWLHGRLYLDRVELYLGGDRVHVMPRVHGDGNGIDWRDMAGALVKKPGALAGYRYRDAMLPTPEWRQLWQTLRERLGDRGGDREYLQILSCAAEMDDATAGAAVARLLSGTASLSLEGFRDAAGLSRPVADLAPFVPDLSSYDSLLEEVRDE